MAVQVRLLGEVELRVDGRRVELGHLRQRCVLATLLVEANRSVPPDRLLDLVWGGSAPQRAMPTLYGYLSRLRRVLASADGIRLARGPDGYRAELTPGAVDLYRFRHLVAEAQAAVGEPEAAEARYTSALSLWSGEAFGRLDTPWLNEVRATLDRQRHGAELARNELVLARGGHAELLDELAALSAAHPLDERVAGQLMVTLYRSGRQADALALFHRLRHRLAEEVGADPSPPLRRLHHRILTADPSLEVPIRTGPRAGSFGDQPAGTDAVPPVPRPVSPVPRQLPASSPSFTGRASALAELDQAVGISGDGLATVVVSACGGMGKTWLVIRWGHDNTGRFPDGQLYANLRGFDPGGEPVPPSAVVRGFLDALGVPGSALPADPDAQFALYRSLLAGRRVLIVLDNARDSEQVAPLLPGSARGAVLVTSRHQLTGLVTAYGARLVPLDVFGRDEARQLLAYHLGTRRAAAEPAQVDALVRHCAGLPLALGIVAARAAARPGLALAELAAELRRATTRLDALDAGELRSSLRIALSCSQRDLPPSVARLFRLLGLMPGPDIGLPAVASLAGVGPDQARGALRTLTRAHLVQEHRPGRFRMHDLIRLHAAECAAREAPDEATEAAGRVLDHYLHTGYAAARLLHPLRDPIDPEPCQPGVVPERLADGRAASAWFAQEQQVLCGAVRTAENRGADGHVWRLAWVLWTYLDRGGHWPDQLAVQRAALRATERLGDRAGQARVQRSLGHVLVRLGRYEPARERLGRALALFAELGDATGQGHTHRALARLLAWQGRDEEASRHAYRALELYRSAGDAPGEALALNAVGWYEARLGEQRRALAYCREALVLHRRLGDRHGQAAAWDTAGYAYHQLGLRRQAVLCYQRALRLSQDIGDRYQEAETLDHLGDTRYADGDLDEAHLSWREALTILDEIGHPDASLVRRKLVGTRPVNRSEPGPSRAQAGSDPGLTSLVSGTTGDDPQVGGG